jgi:hypothetical protein
VEPLDLLGEYAEVFENPAVRAASWATSKTNGPLDRSAPRDGSEERPLGERLFWPLLLCITYMCAATLLGEALT